MRALVVDDSRFMRVLLASMLKELGFEVSEAADGREALDRLRQDGKPDVALVDWNMPVMSGHDFIKAVRASAELGDLPLMMVTTETELDQVSVALAAGANEYVMKPFTRDVIKEKLELLGVAQS